MAPLFQNPVVIEGTLYIASDFHFGSPDRESSKEREKRVIRWLDMISRDATHLILLGDIFDFWFEYKYVVPRGYFNFLAKLNDLKEKNIEIYYFTGNHDMWVKDYFRQELGIRIFTRQQAFLINGKKCLLAHGDGLGPKDKGYKLIKKLFAFKPHIKIYGSLHPQHAFGLAHFLSRKSRAMKPGIEESYMGDDKEMLVQYALSVLQNEEIDYFIYGHRHLPIEKKLDEHVYYINTGDWLIHNSYVRFGKDQLELLEYHSDYQKNEEHDL